jgi:hypothetical protein
MIKCEYSRFEDMRNVHKIHVRKPEGRSLGTAKPWWKGVKRYKIKLSPQEDLEAHKVVRCWGSHIF